MNVEMELEALRETAASYQFMNIDQAAELETLRTDVRVLREAAAKIFDLSPGDLNTLRGLRDVLEMLAAEDPAGNSKTALGLVNALIHTHR